MRISFQTFAVGIVVTIAHLAIIAAVKPASLQASKYFQGLEMESFVKEILVKPGADAPVSLVDVTPEGKPGTDAASGEGTSNPLREGKPDEVIETGSDRTVEANGRFLNLEKEMDSMKAVTDVRVLSGRIEEPRLKDFVIPHPVAEASVAEPNRKAVKDTGLATGEKAVKVGPFELREIRPVAR